ncbi:MAG: N-formylglutamate amidohydrolase [Thermoleophilia bacterium]|nr:N-formylglutamate amidohydrolase [Thermoleophilia bacterium]
MSESDHRPFEVTVPQGSAAPLIAHVPHAATHVPERVRRCIVLDDAELRREIVRLTDWHVERLFSWVPKLGGELFASTLSRVAFDPERFEDDSHEPMTAVGQGVVYTGTTQRGTLAEITSEERAWRIGHWYRPYHEALEVAVGALLARFGTALILDCHSFATVPLPSEPDQRPGRPDICLGTDELHTPLTLVDALGSSLAAEGLDVRRDAPFAGTIVPARFYGTEAKVRSVMIEVRRGLYCDEATGEPAARFDEVAQALERAVGGAVAGFIGPE